MKPLTLFQLGSRYVTICIDIRGIFMIKKWWMESIGYQIYPKSFFDSNHDGIGDLLGLFEKLDYLNELGVNLIWICPFYDSPMDDNGYDVRNFKGINPIFGTLEHLKAIIDKAHKLDMKVIFDFVLNHTSDEHPWFIESRKSKDNPYRDYYIWHDGKEVDHQKIEPTNWGSFFGGSCWQKDELTNSYYMKIFSSKMPDLNWKNEKVHTEMIDIAKWYLELGADGFRIDAVSHLDRAPFVDSDLSSERYVLDWNKFSNLDQVHVYLKKLNETVFKPYDALTIGEVGGSASIEAALKYASFDRDELSMVFNFDHNWCNNMFEIDDLNDLKTNLLCLKNAFLKWQTAFKNKGWLPLNWLNHDQPRLMSQYGSLKYFNASAKMLATALHMMRGTPFIYQGEEIGMTNYPFESINQFNDIATIQHYHELIKKYPNLSQDVILKRVAKTSRDHPRTPIQWDDTIHAGFSKVQPYLNVNPNYLEINVRKAMNEQNSIWHHYKKLIQLRKNSLYKEIIVYGDYKMIDQDNEFVYSYLRKFEQKRLLVINSFYDQTISYHLKNHIQKRILSNYDDTLIDKQTIQLRPYESIIFLLEETK
jgi:oligo-1,6-glucosidase